MSFSNFVTIADSLIRKVELSKKEESKDFLDLGRDASSRMSALQELLSKLGMIDVSNYILNEKDKGDVVGEEKNNGGEWQQVSYKAGKGPRGGFVKDLEQYSKKIEVKEKIPQENKVETPSAESGISGGRLPWAKVVGGSRGSVSGPE